jgi:uncharacterized membrane protein
MEHGMEPADTLATAQTAGGVSRALGFQLALAALGVAGAAALVFALGHPHLHAFDFDLFARQSLPIRLHIITASTALLLGLIQFAGPKGTTVHRAIGWSWVLLMITVAGSSFFIHSLNKGGFSLIHVLSAYVLVAVPLGVYAARRGKVDRHRGYMTGVFVFGLIVAGAFTFVPGRLMWNLLLG